MEQKKRVNCLYRVSTIGQVEKDDIPMQRQFCREFIASHPDWVLQNEFYEKGVSGFKKSAKEPLPGVSIFCLSICLTVSAAEMTKRPLS